MKQRRRERKEHLDETYVDWHTCFCSSILVREDISVANLRFQVTASVVAQCAVTDSSRRHCTAELPCAPKWEPSAALIAVSVLVTRTVSGQTVSHAENCRNLR